MSKLGSAAKGAAGGAVAGSAFGPYGTAIGAGVGGIYGWLSDTSDEQASAEKQKLAGMQKAANVYQGYRPQVMGARQQGLQQTLSAYNGAGNAMGLMYGTSYNPANYAPNLGKLPDPSSYAPSTPTPAQPKGETQEVLNDAAGNLAQKTTNIASGPLAPLQSGTPEVVRGRTATEFALPTKEEQNLYDWADAYKREMGRDAATKAEIDAFAASKGRKSSDPYQGVNP